MTPQPQEAALDTASVALLFQSVSVPKNASATYVAQQRDSALATVATLAPRDLLEALLSVRIVALHHATMGNMARGMHADLAPSLALRFQGRACVQARLMDQALDRLERRQGRPVRQAVPVPARVVAAVELPDPAVETAPIDPPELAPQPAIDAAVGTLPDPVPAVEAVAPQAEQQGASPAAPGAVVYRETRRRELEARVARGQVLTRSQQEWLRRELARQAGLAEVACAA